MATDFELAHNLSVFEYNGSISSSGIYARCSNCRLQNQHHIYNNFGARRYSSPNRSSAASGHQERKPRRPCLVNRSEDSTGSGSSSSGDETEPISPSKQKKKVVFADDRGLSLTQVRMMVQLPHSQPFTLNLSSHTDNKLKLGNDNTFVYNSGKMSYRQNDQSVVANRNFPSWKSTFNQPASNYVDFRRKLDEDNVSLENVIIKQNYNPDKELIGTIKVKNICYEKTVFIRTTTDDWLTHQDVECSFVGGSMQSSPMGSSSVIVIYDTFSFKMILPSSYSAVQFCVCFRATQGEFWDNNRGKNYKLVKNDQEAITKSTNMKDFSKSSSTASSLKSHTWPKFTG